MNTKELFEDFKAYLDAALSQAFTGMATKDDIANMATKDDIANMATKADIAKIYSEMATKDDIANMATKGDIASIRSEMATKEELIGVSRSLHKEMRAGFSVLSRQMSDLDLKVDTIADAQAETYQDHEHRITRLEKRAA